MGTSGQSERKYWAKKRVRERTRENRVKLD